MTEIVNSGGYNDAFGNILQETGPSVPGGFTYTGRARHARSGLYYYRARWYDPELGRFLTQDPIGPLGGVNLYAYVGNAPVDLVDPLGLLTDAELVQLEVFMEGQEAVAEEYRKIASGEYSDSAGALHD